MRSLILLHDSKSMHIGVFDSGLGGVVILKALLDRLPQYDYVYCGDTRNAPYGDKTHEEIFELTVRGVEFLFSQGCSLVILACNSASAQALRQVQQEWLPTYYPDKKVLGVLIPVAEAIVAAGYERVGIIATTATITSGAYEREIHKLNPQVQIVSRATPCLVPLVERGQGTDEEIAVCVGGLRDALRDVEVVVPGCTHYPLIARQLEHALDKPLFDAPAHIAQAFERYLAKHPEIEQVLSRGASRAWYVSEPQQQYSSILSQVFEESPEFDVWS